MKKCIKAAASCVVGAMMLAGCATTNAVKPKGIELKANQFKMIVDGYDWGPGISRVVVNAGKNVKSSELSLADFTVTQSYEDTDWSGYPVLKSFVNKGEHALRTVYVSDAAGNPVDGESSYVTIVLAVHPADGKTDPFIYTSSGNRWRNPSDFEIKNAKLNLEVTENAGRECPLADEFITGSFKSKADKLVMGKMQSVDVNLTYAAWEPEHKGKTPLVIWLHGGGEGGTDPYVAILGNKVTSLITPEIQSYFGKNGAYVLAPQCPTMWMENGTDENGNTLITYQGSAKGAKTYYTEPLMQLIQKYVKSNPDIDTSRIYVGGCSNGGYMTVNMMLNYPDYFAAGYPTCEGYRDEDLSDEDIKVLAAQKMWFVQALNDTTLVPEVFGKPTIARLEAEKAPGLKYTWFDDVKDTTGEYKDDKGNPYEYMGHWSWIHVFNDLVKDEQGNSLWSWLSAQHK